MGECGWMSVARVVRHTLFPVWNVTSDSDDSILSPPLYSPLIHYVLFLESFSIVLTCEGTGTITVLNLALPGPEHYQSDLSPLNSLF